jgi:hypothetical protein
MVRCRERSHVPQADLQTPGKATRAAYQADDEDVLPLMDTTGGMPDRMLLCRFNFRVAPLAFARAVRLHAAFVAPGQNV